MLWWIPCEHIPTESEAKMRVTLHLSLTFNTRFKIVTAGLLDEEGKQLIDHVAIQGKILAQVNEIIPKKTAVGLHLSDHVGIIASIKPVVL